MIKRTVRFCFFLVTLMLIGIMAWAGGGKENVRNKSYIIGNYWEDYDVNAVVPKSESGELTLDWRKKIQRDHGFSIREKMIGDWGSMLQTVTTSIMAGKPEAHTFWITPTWAMSLYRQGLITPVDTKAVNLNEDRLLVGQQAKYNPTIGRTFTFGGKQYAFALGFPDHSYGIFFNKRLFREAGMDPELPYDMVKANTWTWDNFIDICRRLTRDRNNTGRVDTWAMPVDSTTYILEAFAFANGAQYVTQDAQGRFVNAAGRPEFLEAFNFCRRLFTEDVMMMRPDNTDWDWYYYAFLEGRLAMMVEQEWRRQQLITGMVDDWGYVLAPRGPRVQTIQFPNDDNVFVIPHNYADQVDGIITAVDLWFTPISDDYKAPYWSEYRDPRAVNETMAYILTSGNDVFRNHIMIPGLETGDIAWQMWFYEGDPAQLIESVSPNWNALIADVNR